MSTDNTVNSLASSFVAMAHAFEELPKVQAELDAKSHAYDEAQKIIQELQLRLIDRRNEIEAAHAATRKAEVERDHAENMFLETDDKLNAFKRLVSSFQADVSGLVKASEPEPTGFETDPVPSLLGTPMPQPSFDPGPAIGNVTIHGDPSNIDSVSTGPTEGVSVSMDPQQETTKQSFGNIIQPQESGTVSLSEEAPHPVDPTASSTAGDGHSLESVEVTTSVASTTDASGKEQSSTSVESLDDVGYHNEPPVHSSNDTNPWFAWDQWCNRMNAKYGPGGWPPRNVPSVA